MKAWTGALAGLFLLAGSAIGDTEYPLGGDGSEQIVAALDRDTVAITADFSGGEIFIYGAVKREAPAPTGAPLDVVVVVIGPSAPVIVRRKERRFGVWVNASEVVVDQAPSFYAVASTRSFRESVSFTDDQAFRIGLDHVVRLIGDPQDEVYPEEYRIAVERIRASRGLYYEAPGTVEVLEETLFRTSVSLPADLLEGLYEVRIFLTRDRRVVAHFTSTIDVQKTGIERWLYDLAHEEPALYGLLTVIVALAAGWGASATFRYLLR